MERQLDRCRSVGADRLVSAAKVFAATTLIVAAAFAVVGPAEAQEVLALNPIKEGQATTQPAARAGSLNVITSASAKPIAPAVAAYARRFEADPDPLVRQTAALYAQAGGQALWYRAGAWTAAAQDALRILEQARYDGLPPETYLQRISGGLEGITTHQQAAVADFALTLGLQRFALDLKYGLGGGLTSGAGRGAEPTSAQRSEQDARLATLARGFKAAYQAQDLDAWIDAYRPETPLYLRLHKALLLNELTEQEARKAALALHRERAPLSLQPERHIVVDLGLQQLRVYENQQERLAMPVVVGTAKRRTPLLSDQIVDLKFSPDWIVPPVIAREDLLPILQRSPALIADMGIDILDDQNRRVIPGSVPWSEVDPFKIPFRFRMQPGIDNLLGGVRFSLTNDLAIYLHDSPERDRYASGVRSFSSGCVRVGDAVALASWIMGRQKNWTRAQVIAAMVKGETRVEKLQQPIQVDFVYSTLGFGRDGALLFKPDIYGEDWRLARRLGLPVVNDVPPPLPQPLPRPLPQPVPQALPAQ